MGMHNGGTMLFLESRQPYIINSIIQYFMSEYHGTDHHCIIWYDHCTMVGLLPIFFKGDRLLLQINWLENNLVA